jgi:hypothetical protein
VTLLEAESGLDQKMGHASKLTRKASKTIPRILVRCQFPNRPDPITSEVDFFRFLFSANKKSSEKITMRRWIMPSETIFLLPDRFFFALRDAAAKMSK